MSSVAGQFRRSLESIAGTIGDVIIIVIVIAVIAFVVKLAGGISSLVGSLTGSTTTVTGGTTPTSPSKPGGGLTLSGGPGGMIFGTITNLGGSSEILQTQPQQYSVKGPTLAQYPSISQYFRPQGPAIQFVSPSWNPSTYTTPTYAIYSYTNPAAVSYAPQNVTSPTHILITGKGGIAAGSI